MYCFITCFSVGQLQDSSPLEGRSCLEFQYVKGAADDEESWSRGLTPTLFWENWQTLSQINTEEPLQNAVDLLVATDKLKPASPSVVKFYKCDLQGKILLGQRISTDILEYPNCCVKDSCTTSFASITSAPDPSASDTQQQRLTLILQLSTTTGITEVLSEIGECCKTHVLLCPTPTKRPTKATVWRDILGDATRKVEEFTKSYDIFGGAEKSSNIGVTVIPATISLNLVALFIAVALELLPVRQRHSVITKTHIRTAIANVQLHSGLQSQLALPRYFCNQLTRCLNSGPWD